MEENVRFGRGHSLRKSNVFFHNGGKLRNLGNVKDPLSKPLLFSWGEID